MHHLDFGRRGGQGAWVGLAGGNLYIPGVSLEGPGPGGVRFGWDQGAKRDTGENTCVLTNDTSRKNGT